MLLGGAAKITANVNIASIIEEVTESEKTKADGDARKRKTAMAIKKKKPKKSSTVTTTTNVTTSATTTATTNSKNKSAITATKKPKRAAVSTSVSKKADLGGNNNVVAITSSSCDEEKKTEAAPLSSLKKSSARKRKPTVVKESESESKTSTSAATGKSKSKSNNKSNGKSKSASKNKKKQGESLYIAPESDSDDEKDRPYRVEYASTGRSTCKSCDEKIEKNCLRIACRPLFRGKPGFVCYRHLRCQILPEEITQMNEVGGWRRLKPEDKVLLEKQLEESKLRIDEENQEMDADELVQTAFQGELREAPPGLEATLLPFQREGVSWMYNQEKSEVKGGIEADEMGMVSAVLCCDVM